MSNDECLLMNDMKNMFYIKLKYFFFLNSLIYFRQYNRNKKLILKFWALCLMF